MADRIADMHEAAVRGERERIAAHLRAEIAERDELIGYWEADNPVTADYYSAQRAALVDTLTWLESHPNL